MADDQGTQSVTDAAAAAISPRAPVVVCPEHLTMSDTRKASPGPEIELRDLSTDLGVHRQWITDDAFERIAEVHTRGRLAGRRLARQEKGGFRLEFLPRTHRRRWGSAVGARTQARGGRATSQRPGSWILAVGLTANRPTRPQTWKNTDRC